MSEPISPGEPVEVVIADQTYELVVPASPWLRQAIWLSLGEAQGAAARLEVSAAALFLCWTSREHKKGTPRYKHNIPDYGVAALDYMFGNGATMNEVIDGTRTALHMVIATLPKEADHEAAVGNSEAPTGASSESVSP